MEINFIDNDTQEFFFSENYLNRIINLDRFIEFQENKFVFISPSKWSDPYEKAFLQAKYEFNEQSYFHPLRPIAREGHKLYAQCWTAGKQTEAMWKGFAPNEDGVMIQMSTRNILKILNNISHRGSYNFYIGKVNYQDSEHLYDMKAHHQTWVDIANGRINPRTIGLIFKKRQAFEYEKEYRILAIKRSGRNKRFFIQFTFEEILGYVNYLKFDPRMGEKLFNFTKQTLQNDYPELDIHKSRLYKNPIKRLVYGGIQPREFNDEIIFN